MAPSSPFDAMGTQKAIAAQIVDSGADYVFASKGKQETLHQEVIVHVVGLHQTTNS
jgi:predicted transposase YbfD/YdcC